MMKESGHNQNSNQHHEQNKDQGRLQDTEQDTEHKVQDKVQEKENARKQGREKDSEQNNQNQNLKQTEAQKTGPTDSGYFSPDSEDFYEAFTDEEEDLEIKPNPIRIWMIRAVAFAVILALSANILAVWPSVVNIPAIQFLKKSAELSKMESIQRYKEAVVVIEVDNRRGTGFNISSKGTIITNHHVIENGTDITVRFPNGKAFKANVLISQADQDLAVLQLITNEGNEELQLATLELETEVVWEKGEQVYFIGNPLSFSLIANEGILIDQVLYVDRELEAYILDAPVYRGNSGSPVINKEGKVIGVIFAKSDYTYDQNNIKVGVATPIYYLHDLLNRK
jgi:serine protease Do